MTWYDLTALDIRLRNGKDLNLKNFLHSRHKQVYIDPYTLIVEKDFQICKSNICEKLLQKLLRSVDKINDFRILLS